MGACGSVASAPTSPVGPAPAPPPPIEAKPSTPIKKKRRCSSRSEKDEGAGESGGETGRSRGAVEVDAVHAPPPSHGVTIYTQGSTPGASQLHRLAQRRQKEPSFMTRLANQGQANGAPACSLIFSETQMEDAKSADEEAFMDRRRTKPLDNMWQTTMLAEDLDDGVETFQFGPDGADEDDEDSPSGATPSPLLPVPWP